MSEGYLGKLWAEIRLEDKTSEGLTSLQNNLKQTRQWTQEMSIETVRLGEKAQRSYGELARGIAGAATAAFSLYMSVERVQTAHVALDRANLMVKTSTRSVEEAQQRYNIALAKFGIDSQETKDALRDIGIAQERLSYSTEKAALSQNNYNNAMLSSVLMVIPSAMHGFEQLQRVVKSLGANFGDLASEIAIPATVGAAALTPFIFAEIETLGKAQEAQQALTATIKQNTQDRETWTKSRMALAKSEADEVARYNKKIADSYITVTAQVAALNEAQQLAYRASSAMMKLMGMYATPESIAETQARNERAARRRGRLGVSQMTPEQYEAWKSTGFEGNPEAFLERYEPIPREVGALRTAIGEGRPSVKSESELIWEWARKYGMAQHGLLATGPTIAMVGEREPELVAPVRSLLQRSPQELEMFQAAMKKMHDGLMEIASATRETGGYGGYAPSYGGGVVSIGGMPMTIPGVGRGGGGTTLQVNAPLITVQGNADQQVVQTATQMAVQQIQSALQSVEVRATSSSAPTTRKKITISKRSNIPSRSTVGTTTTGGGYTNYGPTGSSYTGQSRVY